MKYVRTARGYQSLTLGEFTITGTPLEVSNETAEKLVAAGEEHGIRVIVSDEADETAQGDAVVTATPDLSRGTSAVTGTGPAVTNGEDGPVPVDAAPDATDTDDETATRGGRTRKEK